MTSFASRCRVMEEGCGFRCPQDFVPVAECDRSATSEPDMEFWLIKAPADFSPESFNSHRFPLSGYKMQRIKDGSVKKYYHMVSTPGPALPLCAFLQPSGLPEDKLQAASPLQGVITLSEAHGDHTALRNVPDRPPLSLPQGLKQRFCPFGAIAPYVSEVNREDSQLLGSTKKKKRVKKRKQEEMVDA
ncbi:DNA-directed RNA polymerase I subunit RPA34 isoform X2 [Dendrobates tinctorius]|uniref:DNA-directed RNA polymerase I subunit RPA34 isoform X2 n=1 Tax=Dendrobates tinctorius TaxID=92724 RepID=UPI003CCA59E9